MSNGKPATLKDMIWIGVGSWVALYGGANHFSGSVIGLAAGIGIARIMFGIGAIICWACAIGMALSCVRMLLDARSASRPTQNRS